MIPLKLWFSNPFIWFRLRMWKSALKEAPRQDMWYVMWLRRKMCRWLWWDPEGWDCSDARFWAASVITSSTTPTALLLCVDTLRRLSKHYWILSGLRNHSVLRAEVRQWYCTNTSELWEILKLSCLWNVLFIVFINVYRICLLYLENWHNSCDLAMFFSPKCHDCLV